MANSKRKEAQSSSNGQNKSNVSPDLINFIISNDYCVFCKIIGKDKFYVSIPKSINSPALNVEYTITRQKDKCTIRKYSEKLSKDRIIETPLYAVRPVVVADLCRICGVFDYDPELIVYYDENNICLGYGKYGILQHDIISPPTRKNLKDNELNLMALFIQTEELGKTVELKVFSEEMGLLDGYLKLIEVME